MCKKVIFFLGLFLSLLLSSLFSATLEHRTIGGEFISDGDDTKPWLAKFVTSKNRCSASLIADKWLLTAYHCIEDERMDDILKQTKVTHRGSDKSVGVKNVYLPHKNILEYSQKKLQYDFAIFELDGSLVSDSYAQLPTATTIDNYYGKVDVAWLLGYGVQDIDPSKNDQVLATQLKLSIMDRATCTQRLDNEYVGQGVSDLNSYFCTDTINDAKRRGNDVGMCAGDSGGPLVVKEGNAFVQIGVVSGYLRDGGSRQCGKNSGKYANISYHIEWINDVLAYRIDPATNAHNERKSTFKIDVSDILTRYHIPSLEKDRWYILSGGTSVKKNQIFRSPSKRGLLHIALSQDIFENGIFWIQRLSL